MNTIYDALYVRATVAFCLSAEESGSVADKRQFWNNAKSL